MLWLVAVGASALAAQDDSRFQALASAATKSLGIDTAPAAVNFDAEVVDAHAVKLRLGALELLYPKTGLQDADDLTDLRECALAVCDMQKVWCEWMTASAAPTDLEAARRSVQAWIKGWRWPTNTGTLVTVTDDVAGAQRDFTAAMAKMLSRDPGVCRAQCWLAPTRKEFAEMVGLLGAIAPQNREYLWTADVLKSSEAWAVRPRVLQIVAMEYSAPEELGGESVGLRMDVREKYGLQQHVVQRTASSLAVMAFGDGIDRNFEAGLSQNLVIAMYKENNARTGGSGLGGYAAARSQFVAGGASSGGALAAINLDSQWRMTKGKDHFVRPLKQGQRGGAKHAGGKTLADKVGNFLLQDNAGKLDQIVSAPFLGLPESAPTAPRDCEADYKEMLRAYRSGFVFWLRENAGKNTGDSKQKFGAMLREMAEGGGRVTFELACRRAFGERLTAEGPEPASLEWKFLTWLAK